MFRYKSKILRLTGLFLLFFFATPITSALTGNYKIGVAFQDDKGAPITTALDLRISLWDSYDIRGEDIDVAKDINNYINASATHYGGYQTTFTITPDADGYFVPVTYGLYNLDVNNLPDLPIISPLNAYLQLEYKAQGAPNTDYIIYDFVDDPPMQNVTRYLIDDKTVYYTFEAGPRTNWNTFTLDANNNAATEIKLEFGETLAKFLQWSITNTRFELSNSLRIEGNLATIGEIYTADDHDASDSDGILNFGRNNSEWENFRWNDTNDQFELSDDLSITGGITISADADFNLNQLIEARIENLDSAPTCDANSKGRLYYDTNTDLIYFCNGTSWNQL